MSDERRKHTRLDLALPIRYRIVRNQREIQKLIQQKSSGSRNLSAGGLCVLVNEDVTKEDIVKLQLTLPDEEKPVVAFAEIVWIEPKGAENLIGLRFLAIKEQDVARITGYVETQRASGAPETR